jgi:hypothetical protein
MIDFPLLAFMIMWAIVGFYFIYTVFKWGHDKDK